MKIENVVKKKIIIIGENFRRKLEKTRDKNIFKNALEVINKTVKEKFENIRAKIKKLS